MTNRIIETRPPEPTENAAEDAREALEYMEYAREAINGILREVYKELKEIRGGIS